MVSVPYPSDEQERLVRARAIALQRAYRSFREPVKGEKEPWDTFGESPLQSKEIDAASVSKAKPAAPLLSFDWRDHVAIARPLDQGDCNTCTSFAIAATLEACWLISNPGNPLAVSPGYIHTCIGHAGDGSPHDICLEGIDLFLTLRKLRTAPYAQRADGDYPFIPHACPAAPLLGTIADFTDLGGSNSMQRSKDWLSGGSPIIADMYIWDDFASYTTSRGPAYVPNTTLGGPWLHSVCVVGFNEVGWIIKNSYGHNWGDGHGFGTVAYGACGLIGSIPPPGKVTREVFAIMV